MFRRIRYFWREFSYFSPSFKRGTWVLIGLIIFLQFVIIGFRFYTERHRPDLEKNIVIMADSIIVSKTLSSLPIKIDSTCRYNPNTISYEELIGLGFSKSVAQRWIRYREQGGKFKHVRDICRIYKIDTTLVYQLQNCWFFPKSDFKEKQIKEQLKIEINCADTTMLEKLPGIGKVLSKRIVKYREILGGFYSVEQLREVFGLSEDVYRKIVPFLFVDTATIKPFPINSASFSEMVRHPYMGFEIAKKIDKYRKSRKLTSIAMMVRDSIITIKDAERLRWYLSFHDK
ncbi:MAG: helix-hairpin-helix domain-containing protein [Bacteroidales bacterium]|nr:helix-hairpin-helix domain-containing protein [Bacteroidales bacterium]